jgi:hypothetical protein
MGKRILVIMISVIIFHLLSTVGTAFADDNWIPDAGIRKTQFQSMNAMKRVFPEKIKRGTEEYRPVLIDNELCERLLRNKTLDYRTVSIDNNMYELPVLDNYPGGNSSTTNHSLYMQKQQLDKFTFYLYLLELKRENDELRKRITELEARVKK